MKYFPLLCVLTLSLGLAFVAYDTGLRLKDIAKFDSLYRQETGLPAPRSGTLTGFEENQRRLVLPIVGTDGNWWIIHTQQMVADGAWRVRDTKWDNPPQGREVHWSSGLMWWLVVCGWLRGFTAGGSLPANIEAVGPLASVMLLLGLAGIFAALTVRRFGWLAGSVLGAAFFSVFPIYEYFAAGSLDHHGMANSFGMGSVLFAVAAGAGWVRRPGAKSPAVPWVLETGEAKWWMIGSGICGAAGIWVSAASQVPVLFGLGLGALAAACSGGGRRDGGDIDLAPALWRLWGWAGAAASLGFYLLEYFPHHLGMRLEVNHPLYALAWAGAGQVLGGITHLLAGGVRRRTISRGEVTRILLGACAVAALPLCIMLSTGRFFWITDPFLWALHVDYIQEFQTLWATASKASLTEVFVQVNVLMLIGVPALWLALSGDTDPTWRALLRLALCPAFVTTALAFKQVRWLGVASSIWLVVLVLFVALACHPWALRQKAIFRAALIFFSLLVLLPFPCSDLCAAWNARGRPISFSQDDLRQLVMRDVAYTLRHLAGQRNAVVLSGPTTTTFMTYFGGLKGVGTLYWENLPGLKAAAGIYNARDGREAIERLKASGVTHIVLFSWDPFDKQYASLEAGARRSGGMAFIEQMLGRSEIPSWLRPIPYEIPAGFNMKDDWVAIFEVCPEQSLSEAYLNVGRYREASGNLDGAIESYRAVRRIEPGNLAAASLLASALARSGKIEEARSLAQSLPSLEQARVFFEMAESLAASGDGRTAAEYYRRALAINPSLTVVLNNLVWLLATSPDDSVRDGKEAVRLAGKLLALNQSLEVEQLDSVAAAYAEVGEYSEAVKWMERATELARRSPASEIGPMEHRLQLYRSNQPFHQPGPRNSGTP